MNLCAGDYLTQLKRLSNANGWAIWREPDGNDVFYFHVVACVPGLLNKSVVKKKRPQKTPKDPKEERG